MIHASDSKWNHVASAAVRLKLKMDYSKDVDVSGGVVFLGKDEIGEFFIEEESKSLRLKPELLKNIEAGFAFIYNVPHNSLYMIKVSWLRSYIKKAEWYRDEDGYVIVNDLLHTLEVKGDTDKVVFKVIGMME